MKFKVSEQPRNVFLNSINMYKKKKTDQEAVHMRVSWPGEAGWLA